METEQQIEVGDFITNTWDLVHGPVIGETVYELEIRPAIPCWVIRNSYGLEQLIFKYDSKLVRKADG